MQLEARRRQGRSLWRKPVYAGSNTNAYINRPAMGTERMKSSISAPSIGPDMRATYTSYERNTRVENLQKKRRMQNAAVRDRWTNTGIRATIAYGVMILLVVCLLRTCETLQKQIDEAEASLFVGYAAVDLGLVSDNGVEKMLLTAPADAIVLPQNRQTGSR